MTRNNGTALWVLRILSAILLLAVGGIHLYLVFTGVGGTLAVLFVLQGIAGLALGIGMLVLRGRLLNWATILSLLFMIGSLAALLLALTVGFFGITETWDYTLVIPTVIIESIGIVVLAITTAVVVRTPQSTPRAA